MPLSTQILQTGRLTSPQQLRSDHRPIRPSSPKPQRPRHRLARRKDLPPNVRIPPSSPPHPNPDLPALTLSLLYLYSAVEINTGLICGCMPVLKPFFRHLLYKTPPDRSPRLSDARFGAVWMGKWPDDQTRGNYRNWIELEHGSDKNLVHVIVD